MVSVIVYVIRNGLQPNDSPPDYGPHKTLYNRFVRWNRLGSVYSKGSLPRSLAKVQNRSAS